MADVLDQLDPDDEQDTGLPDNRPADERADSIVQRVKRAKRLAERAQSAWRKEARLDFDFLAGNQWTQEERAKLEELSRVDVVFNRVEPTIESIAGHEVNNRQAVKYIPRQPVQDAMVNELLTNAADWVRDQCDAEDEESDSFVDMLTCGVGATDTRLDYDSNPDGDIVIERADPLRIRWDPAARRRNLTDAAWVQLDRDMTLSDIRAEWPEKADELAAANIDSVSVDHLDDEEPHDATAAREYRDDQGGQDAAKHLRVVTRHEWYEHRTFWRLADPTTGQITEVAAEEYERIQQAVAAGLTLPPAQAVKQRKKVYRTAHVCGGVLLSDSESITQAGFCLNFITGRRDRNRNAWYGVVRPMRDPQRFANKYLSQIEALVRSNAKGGLLVEEGATDNVRKLEEQWAQQDSVIVLNDGAIGQGKLQPKPVNPLPTGIDKLLEFSVSSIRDVTGVNLEALGLADREQAASLELQRRESALTILAPLFNSLRRYRKVQGRVLADLIRRYISDGRLIRVVQGDGTEQAIPLLRVPETMVYDVIVDSSSNAPDQKRQTFAVMGQLIPALEKSGFPTPPEVLDYAPLPQSLVQKWKQAIQAKQAQPPPVPPEIQKAQIQAQTEQIKLQAQQQRDAQQMQFAQWKTQLDAQLEQYKTLMRAQTDAQDRQIRAAIDEQSQLVNAQAAEQKALADTLKAKIDGMAKLIDATAKVRMSAEKEISAARQANVIELRQSNPAGDMAAAAVREMAGAIAQLEASLNKPRAPLRVIRDAQGNIAGVE